uniref:Uncharacterized protein n=1 Tax=uncultured marine virus TaxID=186617 RepID=A0A0F7L701_9VIRU|nr:hypothetical protein DVVG_00008 [uncultured marine virus]
MVGFYDKGSLITGASREGLQPQTGFGENFATGLNAVINKGRSISQFSELSEGYDNRIDQIEKATGKRLTNPLGFIDFAKAGIKDGAAPVDFAFEMDKRKKEFEAKADELRGLLPEETRGVILNESQMLDGIRAKAHMLGRDQKDVMDRATASGVMGNIGGEMAGLITDPILLSTLPISWPNLANTTVLTAMGRVAINEAVIAGVSESVIQAQTQSYQKSLGFKNAGFKQGAINVLMATGGAAFLGSIIGGGKRAFDLKFGGKGANEVVEGIAETVDQMGSRELAATLDKIPNKTPETEALKYALEKDADLKDLNPFQQSSEINLLDPKVKREHDIKVSEADKAAAEGVLPRVGDEDTLARDPQKLFDAADNIDGPSTELIDPRAITIDAKRFQFKESFSEEGVTQRLKAVDEWDHTKAGQVLVFEDASGKQFIADGHQRTALAKRVMDKDPNRKLRIAGIVRREVDGFNAEDVMIEAAMKNIAETDIPSPQMVRDAAKIMRIRPEELTNLLKTLPRGSRMVRIARQLTNVSDESFSAVINKQINPNHAAKVAELVPNDHDLQDAIVKLLIKEGSLEKSDFEVEAIIRQAREIPTQQIKQETLFGVEEFQESLFSERAKILKNTIQRLRQDKNAFRNLIKNKTNIEAAGNQLSMDVNARIAQENAIAIELLQKLANKKGGLSDALTEAAREGKKTGKFTGATRNFTDSVREAISRGDFEGDSISGVERSLQVEAQNRQDISERTATADAEQIKGYDDPRTGTAYKEQAALFDEQIEQATLHPELGEKPMVVGFEATPDGKGVKAVTKTFNEVVEDIKGDEEFINGLVGCVRS